MLTRKFFDRLFPTKGLDPRKYNLVRERDALLAALNKFLPKYEIYTHKRICAFLANCGIETDYFKTSIEYASGMDYDIRKNPKKARELGNLEPGDGPKYKGRSLTQTTGKFNYQAVQKAIGKQLGIDVVANPELLAQVDIAVESACIFWRDHKLNDWADAGAFKQLSAIVNRGDKNKTPLHWPKRLALYKTLLAKIPAGIQLIEDLPDLSIANAAASTEPSISPEQVTPPVSPEQGTNAPAEAGSSMTLQSFTTKYLRHAPGDRVRQVALVASGRVGTGVLAIWNLGLSGKLLTALLAIVITAPLLYALYVYRWRIVGWAQTIGDAVISPA